MSAAQAMVAEVVEENREDGIWRVSLELTLPVELKNAGPHPTLSLDLSSIGDEARAVETPKPSDSPQPTTVSVKGKPKVKVGDKLSLPIDVTA
jgi:hypothetical protein